MGVEIIAPLYLIAILVFAFGVLLGMALGLGERLRGRLREYKQRRRSDALENEVRALKARGK